MKIIFNFTAAPITPAMFKLCVIDVPTFLKEELRSIDQSVSEGKNTTQNGIRLALGAIKDAAPKGAVVGIVLPDTVPYTEWKMTSAIALKVGIEVYIDSEM